MNALALIVVCVTAVVLCVILCTTLIINQIPTDLFSGPEDKGE